MSAENEDFVVEAMARALCVAAGHDPDALADGALSLFVPSDTKRYWHVYRRRALDHYRTHVAMQQALALTGAINRP